MIDTFVYPVSAIMKFWHLVTHGMLPDGTAWLISIILLVMTVRGLIAPLTWYTVRTGRLTALIRPKIEAMGTPQTVEEYIARQDAEKRLRKENGLNPAVGCLPPLIMMPVFIGLYQVVLRMASPEYTGNIGVLNPSEVEAFRETTLAGIPIPAFVSMPLEWARDYGVTNAEVREVVLPILILALIFTTVNMCISTLRSYWTTDFNTKLGRRMLVIVIAFIIVVPMMLWNVALHGPVPLAVIIYWAATNLFTLTATIVFELILAHKYPLGEDVHQLRRDSIAAYRTHLRSSRKEKRAAKAEKKAEKSHTKKLAQEARKLRHQTKRNNSSEQD
ncbi:MAG: membrane protein insertase YidC [Corynebacterium sp.]|nr:membrane protein insertase YidC [Corynebacterium sp.]